MTLSALYSVLSFSIPHFLSFNPSSSKLRTWNYSKNVAPLSDKTHKSTLLNSGCNRGGKKTRLTYIFSSNQIDWILTPWAILECKSIYKLLLICISNMVANIPCKITTKPCWGFILGLISIPLSVTYAIFYNIFYLVYSQDFNSSLDFSWYTVTIFSLNTVLACFMFDQNYLVKPLWRSKK